MMAEERGMLGMAFTNTSPMVIPTRGAKPTYGSWGLILQLILHNAVVQFPSLFIADRGFFFKSKYVQSIDKSASSGWSSDSGQVSQGLMANLFYCLQMPISLRNGVDSERE